FIDPKGRIRSVLKGDRGGTVLDRGVLIDRLYLWPGGEPIYAKSHDGFALSCVAATLVLYALALTSRGRGLGALATAGLAVLSASCGAAVRPGRDAAGARAALAAGRSRLDAGDASGAIRPLAEACAAPAPCREAIPLLATALRTTRRTEEAE